MPSWPVKLVSNSLSGSFKAGIFSLMSRFACVGALTSIDMQEPFPGFMEAMTMDYPIKSKAEFGALRPGEKIKATLNVSASNDEYNLTDIHDEGSSAGS